MTLLSPILLKPVRYRDVRDFFAETYSCKKSIELKWISETKFKERSKIFEKTKYGQYLAAVITHRV